MGGYRKGGLSRSVGQRWWSIEFDRLFRLAGSMFLSSLPRASVGVGAGAEGRGGEDSRSARRISDGAGATFRTAGVPLPGSCRWCSERRRRRCTCG